jgi:hypothetical protein
VTRNAAEPDGVAAGGAEDADGAVGSEGAVGEPGAGQPRIKVFINYRHDDVPSPAWPLYIRLVHRMPEAEVFFDRVTLTPGIQWFEEIKSHATSPGVFLALVGPNWLKALSERMRHGEDDYVVREIDVALRSGPMVTVVPVLIDDVDLPDPALLPPALRSLPERQGVRLRDANLLDDIDRLLTFLGAPPGARRQAPAQQADNGAIGTGEHREHEGNGQTNEGEGQATMSALGPDDDAAEPPRLAPVPVRTHYEMVAAKAENMVVFLGAGANADERDGPWRENAGLLPDDPDVAQYLARMAETGTAGLSDVSPDLAEVAQYARAMHGDSDLFTWLNEILKLGDDAGPGPVHKLLATLPELLARWHGAKSYQMIVTPKYDAALERAFRDAGEPFDVVVYMGPGTDGAGWFRHFPWGGQPSTISEPNTYFGLPIDREQRRLTSTVIVRINGAVYDAKEQFPDANFVITEDNYIDYLSGRTAAQVVPTQILATLKRAHYLFLGYRIADWRLRVFLHRVWDGPTLGGQKYWAVERQPDSLECSLWRQANVELYQTSLVEYMTSLCKVIDAGRPTTP